MSINLVIASFLSHRFPRWGVCQFRLDSRNRDLLLYCPTPGRREAILRDINEISGLDIGIERFIVIHPRFADLIIDCVSAQT